MRRTLFFFAWIALLFVGAGSVTYAAPSGSGQVMLEKVASQEEMRRRILTTVDSAKQYQDMMDKQVTSLKHENKDLHEKLMKLKAQFEAALNSADQRRSSEVPAGAASSQNTSVESSPSEAAREESSQISPITASDQKSLQNQADTTTEVTSAEPLLSQENHRVSFSLITDKLLVVFANLELTAGLLFLVFLIVLWFVWGRRAGHVEMPDKDVGETKVRYPKGGQSMHGAGVAAELVVPIQQMMIPLVSANEEGEYDYIGSSEGIPARLDLARMYRDMGDIAQAELVLKSILAQGDEKQSQEANKLLAEFKK